MGCKVYESIPYLKSRPVPPEDTATIRDTVGKLDFCGVRSNFNYFGEYFTRIIGKIGLKALMLSHKRLLANTITDSDCTLIHLKELNYDDVCDARLVGRSRTHTFSVTFVQVLA